MYIAVQRIDASAGEIPIHFLIYVFIIHQKERRNKLTESGQLPSPTVDEEQYECIS